MKHKVRLKGILKTYLRWPVLLSIFFAAMDVQLFIYNQKAGVIGFFLFYCICPGLYISFYNRQKTDTKRPYKVCRGLRADADADS